MVAGNPAVPHGVNSEGLKRRGFTEEQIRNVREAYRILYRSDLKLAAALERLAPLAQQQPEVRFFVDFIRGSHAQPGAMSVAGLPELAAAAPLRVAIVAGEHSGDTLGAALIEALRARVPGVQLLRRGRSEDDRGRLRGLRLVGGARRHGSGRGAAAPAAAAAAARRAAAALPRRAPRRVRRHRLARVQSAAGAAPEGAPASAPCST